MGALSRGYMYSNTIGINDMTTQMPTINCTVHMYIGFCVSKFEMLSELTQAHPNDVIGV